MVQNQIVAPQQIYYQMETTNQSFIDMHYYLKHKGIRNNAFFLALYDSGLAGVDPRDPNLSTQMKQRVFRECCANYWYFLREVVRIPVQGGTVGSGVRYKLHRGNLAMNFLFVLNYNQFVELPRQHFKTTSAECRYLWVYNFGSSNSEIMFIHKDHAGSKKNLKGVKELRDALPSYLQMSTAIMSDGKKLKVPNTVEAMQHPLNHNKITTFASARSKEYANNLGRGCTMPLQYYDEFAFMKYNNFVYAAAMPAYSTASKNAKANDAPYGILITTTPGDLLTDEGNFAYQVRNNATPWNELYYDLSYDKLEELRKANTNSPFFLVSYTYQQLGSGEEYFRQMVVDMLKDWPAIRREVLLEWAKTATNCPFKQEDLDMIKQFCREPIRTIPFGRAMQYQFNVYEDIDLRYPPIIGVDVAGALYQDSSAITVVDSRTTRVTATLNCNYIPTDDLADVLVTLVTQYNMPKAVINIERNGGFGVSVIQRLVKSSIKNNLYYEIKDKVIEEQFINGHPVRQTRKVKVYGTDSSKEVRARLIEILYDRVNLHKDKFIAPILHAEMEAMEVKKNGKVEHSDSSHDDQVFSYLMALRVWYDGIDLMERYGIQKNTIKTDEDVDIEVLSMDSYAGLEPFDVETASKEDSAVNSEVDEQLEYVKQASKAQLAQDFNRSQLESDIECLRLLLSTDPIAKKVFIEKNHYDTSKPSMGGVFNNQSGFTQLPDEIFGGIDVDDSDEMFNDNIAGNLADQWRGLL